MLYGIDIGGTKIELSVFDDQLHLVDSWRVSTPKQDYQKFLSVITTMIQQADQKTGVTGSVGIGLPGFIDSDGKTTSANIPCINGQPLLVDIQCLLDRPVGFENDVNAFALSEVNGGAASGYRHALGVVLGTGVAGGLCVDGILYRGRQGIASEFGHIPLSAELQQRYNLPLRECGCGGAGCVELYLAGPGLQWLCGHFESGYTSVETLVEGLGNGEPPAEQVFTAYIDCLGNYFAQLTLMFDPDIIVLGGGLSNIKAIYQRLPEAIARYLFVGITPPPVMAPQFGDSSGVRGAALLGQQAMIAARGVA